MKTIPNRRAVLRKKRSHRLGAVLSMELVLVLPIIFAMLLALVELGMLWSSGQRVKEASAAGCRTATFRGADESAIRQSIEHTLGRKSLVTNYSVQVERRAPETNEVAVTVSVPMKAAAPDLLGFLGFGLGNRTVVAQTVMRLE